MIALLIIAVIIILLIIVAVFALKGSSAAPSPNPVATGGSTNGASGVAYSNSANDPNYATGIGATTTTTPLVNTVFGGTKVTTPAPVAPQWNHPTGVKVYDAPSLGTSLNAYHAAYVPGTRDFYFPKVADLAKMDNKISSMTVSSGCKATLWEHSIGNGRTVSYDGPMVINSLAGANMDNTATSMRVVCN
jgi:hypothetical protein